MLYLIMKKETYPKLIILLVVIVGFIIGYSYYASEYNNALLDTFLMPGLFICMIIGGGPHGNMSEVTVGLGASIQFFILYVLIKYIFTLLNNEKHKKI